MKPNPAVSAPVWELFEALPSQTRPQRGAKPAKRLTALAHELASDDILPGAGKLAHAEMHKAWIIQSESLRSSMSQLSRTRQDVIGSQLVRERSQTLCRLCSSLGTGLGWQCSNSSQTGAETAGLGFISTGLTRMRPPGGGIVSSPFIRALTTSSTVFC